MCEKIGFSFKGDIRNNAGRRGNGVIPCIMELYEIVLTNEKIHLPHGLILKQVHYNRYKGKIMRIYNEFRGNLCI